MRAFADWLRDVRLSRGFSQERLADAALSRFPGAAIRQARFTEWEGAKGLPSLRQLEVVCRTLRLSPEERADGRALWEAVQLDGLPPDHDTSDPDPVPFEDQPTEFA